MPERAGPTLRAASPVYPEDSVVVRQRRTEERPVEARCSSLDSSLSQPSLFLRWSVGRTHARCLPSVGAVRVLHWFTSENGATRTLARRPGPRSQTVTADTVKISTTRGGIEGEGKRAKHRRLGQAFRLDTARNSATSFQRRRRCRLWACQPLVRPSLLSFFFACSRVSVFLSLPFATRREGDDEGGQ